MSHKSIAVVTGAGRGIGRAVVLRLAQGGCSVLFTARTKSELDSLKLELELLYPQQHFACARYTGTQCGSLSARFLTRRA
ncbi:MAG: SDR family NAD(P)-dependent oxidoreductase [Betaproteobacteria bacterium]|nr:SDR family NAD(P)-dependent oxidoreductase [Betaproteobacteria bacterium]